MMVFETTSNGLEDYTDCASLTMAKAFGHTILQSVITAVWFWLLIHAAPDRFIILVTRLTKYIFSFGEAISSSNIEVLMRTT